MRIIAITTPKVVDEDGYIITSLLDLDIDILHLRKPESGIDECRKLLETLSDTHRRRIVIHDYPELYDEFSLRGIHINRRVTQPPKGYDGLRTRSCHSFEEVVRFKGDYDYLLLSPIFDSISKSGYGSAFSSEELRRASQQGIIDERVVALGGITLDKIDYLRDMHFGGVAMVGAIYSVEGVARLKELGSIRG